MFAGGVPEFGAGVHLSAMRPIEITRGGIAGTLAVFVVATVCIWLGVWQLDRREQRLERNAAIAERLADPTVDLTSAPMDTAGLTDRRAVVTGLYDNARSFVLGGRSLAGSPGVHVFSPLRIGGGAVLVNRGWFPSLDAATADLEALAVDSAVTASGVLTALPETGTAEPGGPFRSRWFRLDADAVRAQYPYPVSPLYLQLVSTEDDALRAAMSPAIRRPVPLPPPALDAGPHLSYAFQWFGFAAIFVIGWAALVMRRGRRPGASGTTARP